MSNFKFKRTLLIVIVILLFLLGIGFGMFGTFGGYWTTRRNCIVASLILSFVGSALLLQKRLISLLYFSTFFIFSQLIYELAVAVGQVIYFSPPISDFFSYFIEALSGSL